MNPSEYFLKPRTTAQKQFCALAAYFKDGLAAKEVAARYGYSLSSFYTLVRNFSAKLEKNDEDPFFVVRSAGRRRIKNKNQIELAVMAFRNNGFSNAQIARAMRTLGHPISQPEIWRILSRNGFTKLERRTGDNISKSEAILSNPEALRRFASLTNPAAMQQLDNAA